MTQNGISSKENDDGTTHYTEWDGDWNMRYSYNEDADGNRTERHITDQDDNQHVDLEPCHADDDDYSRRDDD